VAGGVVGGVVGGAVEVVPFSMTVTTISTCEFSGTLVAVGNSVMTVPLGARSGTLSHAVAIESAKIATTALAPRKSPDRKLCVTMIDAKDNTLMYLEGQGDQRGYAMAAMLVAVAVMAVLMSVAMPVWRHQAQREKEAELVFRGEQWVRGLNQWARKNGPGSRPPSLDALVQARMVRKKWKDPMTGEDFVPVYLGQQPGQSGQPGPGRGAGPGGRGSAPVQPGGRGLTPPGGGQQPQGNIGGGLMGVRSGSTETSIRIYQGQTRYDQWPFLFVGAQAGAPGGAPGVGAPGGRGRGVGPGGRGRGAQPGTNPGRRGGPPVRGGGPGGIRPPGR
jgi:type II secretory pathway pseudopilin PulG